MSKILERIKEYYEYKGMNSRSFSLSVGRSGAYFSNSLKKGSSPTSDMLSYIFEKYDDLNARWVLTGEGKMIDNPHMVSEKQAYYGKETTIDELVDKKIEERFKDVKETLMQLVGNEIRKELQDAIKEKQQEEGSNS